MKRRDFITLLGIAAAARPLAARAQQAMPVIGFIRNTTRDDSADLLKAMHEGLRQTGYVQGRNLAVEYRFADNQLDRLPTMAADLVRRQVAVIVTGGDASSFAAKAATTTIPVIFSTGFDGGLNRSTQHSILKGKDGVFGNASRLFSRLYGIRENRALGSLAAGRVAESDWASVW